MTPLPITYLILAILGITTTMYFNIAYFLETGTFNIQEFVSILYATNAGASIMNDLTVAYLAFLFWLFAETRRLGMQNVWIFFVLSLIAFAFAFPLFLYFRERFLRQQTHEETAAGV